jgi:hypothetical protein
MSRALDAGAALGVAALVVSGAGLLAQHAPALSDVAAARPGSGTADDLRTAELATGVLVVTAGGVAAVAARAWWPFLLAAATVGIAVGVYEFTLYFDRRSGRSISR